MFSAEQTNVDQSIDLYSESIIECLNDSSRVTTNVDYIPLIYVLRGASTFPPQCWRKVNLYATPTVGSNSHKTSGGGQTKQKMWPCLKSLLAPKKTFTLLRRTNTVIIAFFSHGYAMLSSIKITAAVASTHILIFTLPNPQKKAPGHNGLIEKNTTETAYFFSLT